MSDTSEPALPGGPGSGGGDLLRQAEAPAGAGARVLSPALRSRARHLAMLALYSREAHRFAADEPIPAFLNWLCQDPPRRARARALIEAALAGRERLDALLGKGLTDWTLERVGAVERALMRVAAAELIGLRDAPVGAVLNDCVDLARRYGDEHSPAFVNAVLSNFTRLPEVATELARRPADERGVDLHAHTHHSDGDLSPAALVAAAAEAGLVGLAVADHDSVAGVAEALAAGAPLGVEIVPAVELTAYRGEAELHVLGLFIDPANAALGAKLAFFRAERRRRAEEICRKLDLLGAPVSFERVLEIAGPGAVGRPHVAKALVAAGHCPTLDDAFRRFLKNGGPAWVSKAACAPEEAIALIHAAGGLAFIAHPGVGGQDELLPGLVAAGLDGLEVRHGLHPPPVAEHYLHWAHRRDLLVTGGSDFHGSFKADAPLGRPFVPETWLIELRNHWKLRSNKGV